MHRHPCQAVDWKVPILELKPTVEARMVASEVEINLCGVNKQNIVIYLAMLDNFTNINY